ncbi:hypothetical protein GUJ93_ZPchr0715g29017 [Zizania palustris]|uniref:Uncharacterized protein n=1 Tax=Zizania palustris TaxID=103762 RepID=A0A8J5V085_ZIZPA|nr:hypothetical protein GUJ93_ZPchr0715g29017 [Zizania palustris]
MPPQLPPSRVKPSPSAAADKKPSAIFSPAKKTMARPTSTPDVMALAATGGSSTPAVAAAKRIARTTSSSKLSLSEPSCASKPRPLSSMGAPKKPPRPSSEFAEPPRAAASVHPVRRLTCGTAVYVRTRYVNITDRCCLVIWLPARVVSSSDAYHYTVKYAADLHAMFAGRVVRVPAAHVRLRPTTEPPPSRARRHTHKGPTKKNPSGDTASCKPSVAVRQNFHFISIF